VDLKNPRHLEKLRGVFAAANRARLPLVVHARDAGEYGREEAELLLTRILPAAPDVVVQMAHLWGGGGCSDEALAVYAEAVASGRPVTKNLSPTRC
jgi:hypothetical protein